MIQFHQSRVRKLPAVILADGFQNVKNVWVMLFRSLSRLWPHPVKRHLCLYHKVPCFIIFKLEIQVQYKCGSYINTLYINLTAGLGSDSPVVARFPSDLFCTCSIFMLSQHIEATE